MGANASSRCKTSGKAEKTEAKAEGPPRLPRDALPEQPDPDLAVAYSCEVLRTKQGLIKGCWATFEAGAIYRPLPGEAGEEGGPPGLRSLRHALIVALDIVRYAEKSGEVVEADELGEGSYARVFGSGPDLAVKLINERERPWVHKAAVENSLKADRLGIGPRIFGYGTVVQTLGGHFRGTALLLERLAPLGQSWTTADSESVLADVALLSTIGFHNDVKLPNVLRRGGRPTLIDFDLMSQWSCKVAVTSSCIEHDFQMLLEPLGDSHTRHFREYYDLFVLTLTLPDGELYRRVLERLVELWSLLEGPVFRPLMETVDPENLTEIPFEVLCRTPMEGVSVCLLDLRGNLYGHSEGELRDRQTRLSKCGHLPQLLRSNGIYWP